MNIFKKVLLTILAIPFALILMVIGLALFAVVLVIGGAGLFVYYIGAFIWYYFDYAINLIWGKEYE